MFDAQDAAFDLERQAVGMPVRSTAAVIQRIEATFLVAVEDFVAGDTGDPEFPAQWGHFLAFEEAGNESESFIHRFTLFPWHLGSPQMLNCVNHVSGIFCKLCVNKLII